MASDHFASHQISSFAPSKGTFTPAMRSSRPMFRCSHRRVRWASCFMVASWKLSPDLALNNISRKPSPVLLFLPSRFSFSFSCIGSSCGHGSFWPAEQRGGSCGNPSFCVCALACVHGKSLTTQVDSLPSSECGTMSITASFSLYFVLTTCHMLIFIFSLSFLRMPPQAFDTLLGLLTERIAKKDTNYQKAISPTDRLALTSEIRHQYKQKKITLAAIWELMCGRYKLLHLCHKRSVMCFPCCLLRPFTAAFTKKDTW